MTIPTPSLGETRDAILDAVHRLPARRRTARTVHLSVVDSPLGPMLLGTTESGLCLLEFAEAEEPAAKLERFARRFDVEFVPGRSAVGEQLVDELDAYFAGTLEDFSTPLDLLGTEFQRRAWRALREIPYGETRSYADQARAIDAPRAVRAVARANGQNRIVIVVPCHRVIGSDGSLTGYGAGVWRKKHLLELERRPGSSR